VNSYYRQYSYPGETIRIVNRDQLAPLLLVILAVLALAASAATLNSARHGSGGVGGADEGVGAGDNGSTFDTGALAPLNMSASGSLIPSVLLRALFVLLLVVGLVVLIGAIYREGWRTLPILVIAAVVFSIIFLILIHFLKPFFDNPGQGGLLGKRKTTFPSGGDFGKVSEITQTLTNDFPTIVFALLAVSILIVAIVLVRATGDGPLLDSFDSETDVNDSTSVQVSTAESAAVGEAAGRAADRIETDTSLSNAIYSAWQEMTDPLDLPRETSTPGEFADAAIKSGMARKDVNELTELFEATRYGGIDASEERERRALAALRRIEREYTGER
jgi:hypothetical protein